MLKILVIAAAAYLVMVGFMFVTQASLLYLPNVVGRELIAAPDGIGLEYEDVWLETSDGVRIHGWFVPGDSTRTLLYFHGNAGNISHRLNTIRQFNQLGLSVFIIDYRGYGESEGRPSEDGLYLDADAAWRYLAQDRAIPETDIIVFGRSLGGSLAAWLAAEHSPRALVVDSSFTSVPDIGADAYPWLPVRLLARIQHPTRAHVTKARCPVLVVHSRDDEIIPFHHGEALFDAASEPKTFLGLRGGHNDAHYTSERTFVDGLRRFLQSTEEVGGGSQPSE